MAITVENLCKSFGEKTVLFGFSARFESNKTSCVMGPSGCGKTTLLNILMGLEAAGSGVITGLDGLKKSAVFQEDRLCENLSAGANVRLVCPQSTAKKRSAELLAALGLESSINCPAHDLSGGMKRRVALARALAAEYDVLFLDEPFKGLDGETKQNAIDVLRRYSKGKTVILVTHDGSESAALGAQIIKIPLLEQ